MAISISNVRFEHHLEALGIGEAEPRISWRFDGHFPDWEQSSYCIEVLRSGAGEPEQFHVNSSDSVLVPWPTASLSSAESAKIRVQAHGKDGQPDTDWSDAFGVETGLFTEKDWAGAAMIAADRETEKDQPHQPMLFRKDFHVTDAASSARLYITSYGLYEAYINGERVGEAVLAPGWQSYKHRQVYDTYDVSHLLETGANTLGVQVGEGWYAGRLGFGAGIRNNYGDTLGVMALLVVTTSNGSNQTVATDLTWQAGTGAIKTSEIYDGEVYDSRLEQSGWSSPAFTPQDATKWIGVKKLDAPYDRLTAPDGPPIRRVEQVALQQVLTSPSGKTILDFGQNFVGWLQLNVAGPEGQIITLLHTEVLENGEVATRPLREAKQTDQIILSGKGVQTWEPTFTYHGFRYVQVDGWPTDVTPLDNSTVTGIVVHTDMEQTGLFECSDVLLNKLHQNVRWSMKGNFMSVPTDCPQRDERLGWSGDAHAFSPTANFLYDTSGFWRGWLKDVQSEQLENNNIPPDVIPVIAVVSSHPTAIWGDVVVANPWNAYNAFADINALRDQYRGAKAWLDSGISRNEVGLWDRSSFQYGDWLDPLAPPDDAGKASTNAYFVADAYLVYVTGLVSKMASILGLEDDASRYSDWAVELKSKYAEAWINSDGTVFNETQTGLALPLYFDLFSGEEQSTAAASRLQNIIEKNNYLVGTGFAGTHLLGLALTKYNLTDTFYQMILQTTVPSWLYQVVMNGTTTWERWDSLLPDGSLNPGSMTSFNHYAFGSVANWIHQTVGGLAPAEPGWKTVKVHVVPGGNITDGRASYISPYGTVSTDWRVDGDGFTLQLVVPPNSHAEVQLPGSDGTVQRVGSGKHIFNVPGYHL